MGDEVKFRSGGTPSKSEARYWSGEIPWVSSGEMTQRRIYDTELHVTEEGAENGTRVVPENTVLVVVRGMSLAKEFRIALTRKTVTFNQDLKALEPSSKIDSGFLFYYLQSQSHAIRDSATDASHGTKKLESRILETWPLPVPDLVEQYAIRNILSAYDDLIENNRRRIQLLEQAARLLYKEWFVHLRFPGHEHVKIKDGVPEVWESACIADIGEVITGKTPSKKDESYYREDIPFIKTPDMHGNLVVIQTEESLSEKGANSQSNKTLPPRSILVSCIGTVGAVSYNGSVAQTNQQINAIVPKDESLRYWAFFMAKDLKPLLEGIGGGATMANVNKSKFSNIKVVIPSTLMIKQFALVVAPQIDQIEKLTLMNSRLTKARDLLLPRLMNGEVAV